MPKRTFNRSKKPRKRIFAIFLQTILLIALAFVLIGVATFVFFAKDLPDPSRIDERIVSQSTKI